MRKGFGVIAIVIIMAVASVAAWFVVSISGGVGGTAGGGLEDAIKNLPGVSIGDDSDDEDSSSGSGEDSEDDDPGGGSVSAVTISQVCNERSAGNGVCAGGFCVGSRVDSDEMTITTTVVNEGDGSYDIALRLRPPSGRDEKWIGWNELSAGGNWEAEYSTAWQTLPPDDADHWDDGYRAQVWRPVGAEKPNLNSITRTDLEQDMELLGEVTLEEGDIPQSGDGNNCVNP